MVIGAFPAAKLGLLAIRQVSKPIANVIMNRAKASKVFRDYICMPPAQMYNWVEVKTKMWALNLGKPVTVPKLNEAMAIELGASLLGEFIIFFIGAGVLLFEYTRQTSNEAKKQEALRQERIELTLQVAELGFRLEKADTQLREVTRVLATMESHSIFNWGKERIPEYQPFDVDKPDQSAKRKEDSDYNANGSFVSRALNYLQTQIFVDRRKEKKSNEIEEDEDYQDDVELQPYVINKPQPSLQ